MVIRKVEYDGANRLLKVRGFSTLDLLSQRVVNPSDTVHHMEVSNVEQGIYDIVRVNLRDWEGFTLAAPQGFTETFEAQYTGTNVLNTILTLADEGGMGLAVDADFENKVHRFRVYKGLDRTYRNGVNPHVVFSDNPANVDNLVITHDSGAFKNMVYVAGEGEGTARVVVPVPADAPVGAERYEHWMDARNVRRGSQSLAKYRNILYSKGVEEINRRLNVLSWSADPVTEGSYEFRKDYDLGDMVTCDSKRYGIRFNTRVERSTEISQYNSTVLKITLGKSTLVRVREVNDA